jgi:hypothetical protein
MVTGVILHRGRGAGGVEEGGELQTIKTGMQSTPVFFVPDRSGLCDY